MAATAHKECCCDDQALELITCADDAFEGVGITGVSAGQVVRWGGTCYYAGVASHPIAYYGETIDAADSDVILIDGGCETCGPRGNCYQRFEVTWNCAGGGSWSSVTAVGSRVCLDTPPAAANTWLIKDQTATTCTYYQYKQGGVCDFDADCSTTITAPTRPSTPDGLCAAFNPLYNYVITTLTGTSLPTGCSENNACDGTDYGDLVLELPGSVDFTHDSRYDTPVTSGFALGVFATHHSGTAPFPRPITCSNYNTTTSEEFTYAEAFGAKTVSSVHTTVFSASGSPDAETFDGCGRVKTRTWNNLCATGGQLVQTFFYD